MVYKHDATLMQSKNAQIPSWPLIVIPKIYYRKHFTVVVSIFKILQQHL